jgi:predicted ATPase/DNA-binding CsgD family transcriptional regulator/DNA-binding XRE family transcriptional regulator
MTRSRVSARSRSGGVLESALAADEIRTRRLRLGLTQAELAAWLGVTANTVARWERGEIRPAHPARVARRLARIGRTNGTSQPSGAHKQRSPDRTAENSRRHNLPAELSSFIGRQQETTELMDLLGTNRLITLMGAGGVGKTRLALRVAAEVERTYLDGAWIVELASVSDPALVVGTVALVLGVREQPAQALVVTLAEALRNKHLLLVLDNCEHLVSAIADLAGQLLRTCPRLWILATSRVALGCNGEVTWRAPSLSLPTYEPGTSLSLADVERSEAVQLFVERAKHAAPRFALSERNVVTVARICDRLDGIPLALELAAARIKVLDAAHLLERLDDRFQILTGGPRGAPPRQQTLLATVEWSYKLLEPAERTLFKRLSVFAGGFTPGAAEEVCGFPPLAHSEVLDLLARLVDKSLVIPETTADGTARLRLLETLRQFATELLAGSELAEVGVRHAVYFTSLAEQAEPHLWGRQQGDWLARLDLELDNLRAALQWSIDRASSDTGLRLAAALHQFWDGRGRLTEGKAWLNQLPLHDPAAPAKPRLLALRAAAYLTRAQGNFDEARSLGEDRQALAEAIGDREGAAWALHHLGVIAQISGDTGRARDLYSECLARFEQIGIPEGIGWSLENLGMLAYTQGELDDARKFFHDALAVFEQFGPPEGAAVALSGLGRVDLERGDLSEAQARFEGSLAAFQSLGHLPRVGAAITRLADLARWRGDYAASVKSYEKGVAILRNGGYHIYLVEALLGLGQSRLALGDVGGARAALEESLEGARRGEARQVEAGTLSALGNLAWALGQHRRALDLQRESLVLSRDMGNRLGIAESLVALAKHAAMSGQPGRATRLFAAAASLRERAGVATPVTERRVSERLTADLRRTLGAASFSAAWAAGTHLSLEQAVAEALADETRPAARHQAPNELTPRELEVLQLLAAGKSNSEVAEQLVLSIRTVERHVANVYEKIGATGRTARALATAHALTHGLTVPTVPGMAGAGTRAP